MIPKKVKILGKDWKIKQYKKHIKTEDGHALGLCDIEHCQIKIYTGMDQQQIRDTMLHELIHAVDDTLALEMTEQQVHALAGGLYGLIKDNPELIKWASETQNKYRTNSYPQFSVRH